MNTTINKAVVAILGAVVTLGATFGLDLSWLSDTMIQAIGGALTAVLVWAVPNKEAE